MISACLAPKLPISKKTLARAFCPTHLKVAHGFRKLTTAQTDSPGVVCFGEVLWDSLPDGLFLGGAPLNVAVHLHRLGFDTRLISSVGRDTLGNEIVRRVDQFGLSTEFIQRHETLSTGFVDVDLGGGAPRYTIRAPVAWDEIAWHESVANVTRDKTALVFGSLAQRNPMSQATLARLASSCDLLVFDVNIRPPFDDLDVVQKSLQMTDLLKLNTEELARLSVRFGFSGTEEEQCRQLSEGFNVETVCLTKGAAGAAVLRDGEWYEGEARRITVVDTVGAGDAFLAGLLAKLLKGAMTEPALEFALELAALVASRPGAIPAYAPSELAGI